jgi:hypothetical protein
MNVYITVNNKKQLINLLRYHKVEFVNAVQENELNLLNKNVILHVVNNQKQYVEEMRENHYIQQK